MSGKKFCLAFGAASLFLTGFGLCLAEPAKGEQGWNAAQKQEAEKLVREFATADDVRRGELLKKAAELPPIPYSQLKPFEQKLWRSAGWKKSTKTGRFQETISAPGAGSKPEAWTYVLRVPSSYNPARGAPLFIFLHGTKGYDRAEEWGNWAASQGMIVLLPFSPSGFWDRGETDAVLFALIRHVRREYSIDANRVYLGGFNFGGSGTWYYGFLWPDLFAGLIPMAGDSRSVHPLVERFGTVPVLCYHGEKDPEISAEYERATTGLLRQQEADVEYHEIPEGQTTDWYDREFSKIQKTVGQWLKAKHRTLQAKKFGWSRASVVVPGLPAVRVPSAGRWIEFVEKSSYGRVDVEITGPNQVEIRVRGVSKARLRLSSRLYDLGKPLTVRWNGKEVFSGSVDCKLECLLRSFGEYEDPEAVWVGELSIGESP